MTPQDGSGHRNAKHPGPSFIEALIYPEEVYLILALEMPKVLVRIRRRLQHIESEDTISAIKHELQG